MLDVKLRRRLWALFNGRSYAYFLFIFSSLLLVILEFVFVVILSEIITQALEIGESNIELFMFSMRFNEIMLVALVLLTLLTLLRSFNSFLQSYISFGVAGDLADYSVRNLLRGSIELVERNNASDLVDAILVKSSTVSNGILLPILSLIPAILVILSLMWFSIYSNPVASCMILAIVTFGYVFYAFWVRSFLSDIGATLASQVSVLVQQMIDTLNVIREVKIYGLSIFFADKIDYSNRLVRRRLRNSEFLSSLPKLLIEYLALVSFGIVVFLGFGVDNESSEVLSVESFPILIAGFFRMLPYCHIVYGAWHGLRISSVSARGLLEFMDDGLTHEPGYPRLKRSFIVDSRPRITIKNLNFSHQGSSNLLFENLNMTLDLSGSFLLQGPSGSGKTTLMEIIAGLRLGGDGTYGEIIYALPPEFHDLESLQNSLAYVPQRVFLVEGDLAANIKISDPALDDDDLYDLILDIVGLSEEVISTLTEDQQRKKIVSSGGQMQRLGLARALWRRPKFLFLDELNNNLPVNEVMRLLAVIQIHFPEMSCFMISHDRALIPVFSQYAALGSDNDI